MEARCDAEHLGGLGSHWSGGTGLEELPLPPAFHLQEEWAEMPVLQ